MNHAPASAITAQKTMRPTFPARYQRRCEARIGEAQPTHSGCQVSYVTLCCVSDMTMSMNFGLIFTEQRSFSPNTTDVESQLAQLGFTRASEYPRRIHFAKY